jgi:putative nucleotidyltransferase-like protein
MPPLDPEFERLLAAMRDAAGVLGDADVPFLLGGGLAVWARGGPETEHDVDFYLRRDDSERALAALEESGYRTERPPEGWLVKAYDERGILVDLIHEPAGGPIGDGHFERAERLEVMAVPMLVASLEDVLVQKLLALREQELDFGSVLEIGRAVREQIDWENVRARTTGSPFAQAYFTLVRELGIAPGTDEVRSRTATRRPTSRSPEKRA